MMPDMQPSHQSALSFRGRRLYGPSPREAGERRAAAFQCFEQSLVLLPSPLHGYGVATVVSGLPPGSIVVAVELESELNLLSLESPESLLPALLDTYPEQLRYFHAPYSQQLLQEVCRNLPSHVRRVQLLSLNNGYSLHAQEYRDLQQGIEDELARLWRNRATTLALGPLWVRNLFRNLPLLASMPRLGTADQAGWHTAYSRAPVVSQANDSSAPVGSPAKPVIVVGAGASLETDIEIIRDLRNEVTLVAADSALMPLQGHGVTPDIVVVLEAQPVNREHFLFPLGRQPSSKHNTPHTACDLSSLPSLARQFAATGGTVFITRFADISLFNRIEQHGLVPATVAPLGSVGVCAIMLTSWLFSGPVGITGFDSAYSGGLPHTRGAASHRWALRRSTRLDQDPLFAFRHSRRPFSVTGKEERTYLSEPNLMSSAERIGELFSSCPRLFDFGSTGLKLGRRVESTSIAVRAALRLNDAETDAGDAASAQPQQPSPVQQPSKPQQNAPLHNRASVAESPVQKALLCSFLESEIGLLTEGMRELTDLESGGGENAKPSALLQLEYLYFDVSPTAPTTTAGRRRALLQAHRYRELLQHSLTELSGRS